MSRLENKKKMGFVQLGRSETERLTAEDAMRCEDTKIVSDIIASYIGPAPSGARFMSPCSGYGIAEHHMCEALGIPSTHRWFCEYHDGRAQGASAVADHVVCGDALNQLKVSGGQFEIGYQNPPFDTDGTEQGGERMEWQFFDRFLYARHVIVAGGISIQVAPQDVFAQDKNVNIIARCLDKVTIVALPKAQRKYREAVVIGIVRAKPRKYGELPERADQIRERLAGELTEMSMQAEPRYTEWPTPKARLDVLWYNDADSTAENAIKDVVAMGGAWTSANYIKRQRKIRRKDEEVRPLFPPTKAGAILGIASGKINNRVVHIAGRRMTIKGTTRETTKETVEVTNEGSTEKRVTHSIVQRTPFIVTVDQDSGAVGQYLGETGIEKLASITGAVDAMIDVYKESVPPIYNGTIPPEVDAILEAMVPVSMRALPGQKPGFTTMQRHIISALIAGFQIDPQLMLNAEMGAGKSVMSLGIVEVLRKLYPTNKGRDFTVLITGPATVIGSRESVEMHDLYMQSPTEFKKRYPRGKTPKPMNKTSQWTAEVRDMLPGWDSVIIETPSQFRAFIERAKLNTGRPVVGMMSLSWLALGMGRENAVNTHRAFPSIYVSGDEDAATNRKLMLRSGAHSDMLEADKAMLKAWQDAEKAKKKKKAQISIDDDGGTSTRLEAGPGVSSRTILRDRLFRCGVAGRVGVPLWHYEGLFCPDCGRRLMANDGTPYNGEKLYREGSKGHTKGICRYCRTKVVSSARVFDSIKDIQVPIFEDPAYLEWYEQEQQVVTAVKVDETVTNKVTLYEGFSVVAGRCKPLEGENRPQRDERGADKVVEVSTRVRVRGTLEVQRRRTIPWGVRPRSNPRMALGEFAKKAFDGMIDVYVADEVHKHKGRDTDQGAMFAAVVSASHRVLGLTGTVYGGKASTVFSLLQRFNSRPLREKYSWGDEREFLREMGIIETITTQVTKSAAKSRTISGRGDDDVRSIEKERAGITASLAQIIWAKAVIVLLKQMGFNLPEYTEDLKLLKLPEDVQKAYDRLQSWGEDTVKEPGGRDCLSSWLQACLVFPYAPWDTSIYAQSRTLGEEVRPAIGYDGKQLFSESLILPHHRELARMAIDAKAEGKGVIIFCEHTRKIDIQLDLQKKLTEIAAEEGVELKIDIMRSKVKGPDRIGWFAEREEAGVNVVLCHPALVDTGVNLIGWPVINFAEPGYKLATAMQAKKRAFRPTQTRPCVVNWWAYANTMSARAIAVISTKMLSAALLGGDDVNGGIFQSDDGMSLLQTLAKQITSGDKQEDVVDLRAKIRQAGQATAREMTQGAADLFPIMPQLFEVEVPDEITNPLPEMAEVIEAMPEILELLPQETVVAIEEASQSLALEMAMTMNFVPFRQLPKNARKGTRKNSEGDDQVMQATLGI